LQCIVSYDETNEPLDGVKEETVTNKANCPSSVLDSGNGRYNEKIVEKYDFQKKKTCP
jgi:hypothetical protein